MRKARARDSAADLWTSVTVTWIYFIRSGVSFTKTVPSAPAPALVSGNGAAEFMDTDAWYGAGQEPVEFPPPPPPPSAARSCTRPRVKGTSSDKEQPGVGKHFLGKHAVGKQVLGAKTGVKVKPTDLAKRKLAPIFKAGADGGGSKKDKAAAKGAAKKAIVTGIILDSKTGKAYSQDKHGKRTPCDDWSP